MDQICLLHWQVGSLSLGPPGNPLYINNYLNLNLNQLGKKSSKPFTCLHYLDHIVLASQFGESTSSPP